MGIFGRGNYEQGHKGNCVLSSKSFIDSNLGLVHAEDGATLFGPYGKV